MPKPALLLSVGFSWLRGFWCDCGRKASLEFAYGKEGSKPTGAYRGSKIHGSNFSSRTILAYIISIFVPWHQSGKNCFYVPNPVKWRANQVENIQLKHILSFKITSLSSLVPLFLSSNLHSISPALITSYCHPKDTQHFGTQTAKLLSSFSKYPKQTLVFLNTCPFTEPYFIS